MVPNKRFHLLPLLLPLTAVTNHVIQLLEPGLNAMLRAVPLAANPLHYGQMGKDETAASVDANSNKQKSDLNPPRLTENIEKDAHTFLSNGRADV